MSCAVLDSFGCFDVFVDQRLCWQLLYGTMITGCTSTLERCLWRFMGGGITATSVAIQIVQEAVSFVAGV